MRSNKHKQETIQKYGVLSDINQVTVIQSLFVYGVGFRPSREYGTHSDIY